MPSAVTAVNPAVWPKPNRFLLTIARYNKENSTKDWASKCEDLRNRNGTDTSRHCAIDAAKYIFCVAYYMNMIGISWEIIHYIIFVIMILFTKADEWTDPQTSNGRKANAMIDSETNNEHEKESLLDDTMDTNIPDNTMLKHKITAV